MAKEEKKEAPKEKKVEKGGKKEVKNKMPSKRYTKYSVKDGKIESKRNCPRCGAGFFLAEHKDRFYCGHCYYVEMRKS